MTYQGYLKYDGQEIVNAQRTATYVDNLMPTFGLDNCSDCDALGTALGEEYTTPIVDVAPWYDPNDPATENFFGLYPLSISGIEDSTREVSATELVGDGTSFGRPRHTGKDVRVTGLLIGTDAAALESGLNWLSRALSGPCGGRDDCGGATLDYYSSCPPEQDWTGFPRVPVRWPVNPSDEASLWAPSGDATTNEFGYPLWTFGTPGASVYRQVTHLIPGEPYRLTLQATGASSAAIEISDVGVRGFDQTWLPLTYDFIAPATTVMLRMYPTEYGNMNPIAGSLGLTDLRIERKAVMPTLLWTDYRPDNTATSGYTQRDLPSYNEFTLRDPSGVTFAWSPSVAGLPLPVGPLFSQSFRGFEPGKQYRMTAYVTMDSFTEGVNADFMLLSPADDLAVEYTNLSGLHRFVSDWTAEDTEQTVGFNVNAATTVPGTVLLNISLGFLFIEEITNDLEITDPNPGTAYERILYQTVATGGPTVEERFDMDCGAMMRVSFSLRAGVPFQFTPSVQIGQALGGQSYPTPQVECVNGGPVRTNLALNPTFGTSTQIGTGWSALGGLLQTTTFSSQAIFPPNFGEVVAPFTGTERGLQYAMTTTLPIVAGAAYTFSAYVYTNIATSVTLRAAFNNVNAYSNGTITIPPNVWTRVSLTAAAPLNQVVTTLQFQVSTTQATLPTTMRIDGLLIEDSLVLGEYFDGATNGGVWLGTANASASQYTPVPASIIIDPDCPPLPSPPLPPTIEEACIDEPISWRRYVLPVPANAVPAYSQALPVITLTSGLSASRQIRMRVYRDITGSGDMSQINPCAYDGEIIVSYMPPFSVMTVDAIERRAWVEGLTIDRQTATQLLYGEDGGPVTWPSMSCGVPYLFTVDVDAAEDTSDLDVSLALGVQI